MSQEETDRMQDPNCGSDLQLQFSEQASSVFDNTMDPLATAKVLQPRREVLLRLSIPKLQKLDIIDSAAFASLQTGLEKMFLTLIVRVH